MEKKEFNTNEIKMFPVEQFNKIKFYEFNRDVKRVKKVSDSINTFGYIKHQPVKLLNTFNSIYPGYYIPVDGQHRIFVCQKLGIPFSYIIINKNGDYKITDLETDIIIENNVRTPFSILDCLKLRKRTDTLALTLLDIHEKYGVKPDSFSDIFSPGIYRNGGIPKYKDCETLIKISQKTYKIACVFKLNAR